MSQSPRNRTLDRLLSRRGVASRLEARELIRAGRVRVEGRVVHNPGAWVPEDAALALDDSPVAAPRRGAASIYAMNKPRGVVTTRSDPAGRPTVWSLLPSDTPRIVPVGRLDFASAGLLLWTNDTDTADALTDPRRHVPRVYRVKVKRVLDDAHIAALRAPVQLGPGEWTKPCGVERERQGAASTWLRFTLREGRNRQIRRMVAAVTGQRELIAHLIRVRFGPIDLGELAPGALRRLSDGERDALLEALREERT